MYTTLIKYGIAGLTTIGLVLGIYFYGHHEGSLAGEAEVATFKEKLATANTISIENAAKERESWQRLAGNLQKDLINEKNQHANDNAKYNVTVGSLRKQSSDLATRLQGMSGQAKELACESALTLANRQYDEVATALGQTSKRADDAAAIANALNAYYNK